MKIPREARKLSRELFGLAMQDGKLNTDSVREISDTLLREKPRHYVPILKEFSRLVRLELEKHHAIVESAEPLDEAMQSSIQTSLAEKFGPDTTFEFRRQPALIGGMRVRLGSDVWDGSIKNRLETLRNSL